MNLIIKKIKYRIKAKRIRDKLKRIDFGRFRSDKILAYPLNKNDQDADSILKQFQNRNQDTYSDYDLMMLLVDSARISENYIIYLMPRLYDYVLNNPGSGLLFLINRLEASEFAYLADAEKNLLSELLEFLQELYKDNENK